jgi:HAD superfamily hydrolase (TIGR01484 family)
MKPIGEMTQTEAAGIRYVLMDIDDTLTQDGKLLAASYSALWTLKEAGFTVIPVTGRPAGWCDCIARQWPVNAVIGENGALVFWEEGRAAGPLRENSPPVLKTFFHPSAIKNNQPLLQKIRARALAEVPGLRDAKDQFARLFDIALDFAEEEPVLSLADAGRVRDIALDEGAMAKISSIHVNIWLGNYDKLSMAEQFLAARYGWNPLDESNIKQVLFVGDSPNDEPMFGRFPLSCAVANINRYREIITHFPAFAASQECGVGFAEIANTVVGLRSK